MKRSQQKLPSEAPQQSLGISASLHSHHHQALGREFATAEELLRADAAIVEVPSGVAERLSESLGREGAFYQPRSWWSRWFRR